MSLATVIEIGITAWFVSACWLAFVGVMCWAIGDRRARNIAWAVAAVLFVMIGGAAALLLG